MSINVQLNLEQLVFMDLYIKILVNGWAGVYLLWFLLNSFLTKPGYMETRDVHEERHSSFSTSVSRTNSPDFYTAIEMLET